MGGKSGDASVRKRYRRVELDEEEEDKPWQNALKCQQGESEGEDYVPIKERRERSFGALKQASRENDVRKEKPAERIEMEEQEKQSLLVQRAKTMQDQIPETEQEKLLREEEDIMNAVTKKRALKGNQELAQGIEYENHCVVTGWKPPLRIRKRR